MSKNLIAPRVTIKSDTTSSVAAKNFVFGKPHQKPPDFFNKRGAPSETPPSIAVDFEENKEKEKEVPPYYQKKQKRRQVVHKKQPELIKSDTFVKLVKRKK